MRRVWRYPLQWPTNKEGYSDTAYCSNNLLNKFTLLLTSVFHWVIYDKVKWQDIFSACYPMSVKSLFIVWFYFYTDVIMEMFFISFNIDYY